MTRPPIPAEIIEDRLIAIARRVPTERLSSLADVLANSGIRTLEVTLDSEDPFDAIGALAADGRLVGAGTVRTAEQVRRAADAGARFVVSPHTDADVIAIALELDLPVMAGAMTPTESVAAWDLGVSAVKLFPASVGGPALLASLRGPLSDITFVPTGGIDASNAGSYLSAGAAAVGVGGWLTAPDDLTVVRRRALQLVEAIGA